MKPYRKHLIIIHGAGPKHYRTQEDGSGDWQVELALKFKKKFKVVTPQFPALTKPNYQDWKALLDKKLSTLHGEFTFVGHSLGGSFLMKYLSESTFNKKIMGIYLVATPFSKFEGFEMPEDYSKLKEIPHRYLYHCIDDVEVPYATALVYQNKLDAVLRTAKGQGHYYKRAQFSEITKDLSDNFPRDLDIYPELN